MKNIIRLVIGAETPRVIPGVMACAVLSFLLSFGGIAQAREVAVFDGSTLHQALRTAQPGDDIVLYPGSYRGLKTESPNDRWHYFHSHRSGTADLPITVRSYSRNDLQQLSGNGVDESGYVFYLTGDHWNIRNLVFHTGQKGIMLDSASHNVLNNIAVYNVRDEGVHFRKSSKHNVLRNCHIYNTGRLKPGFGEAVYVGSHEGDILGDYSNNNRIGGCRFGPGVTAEAVDIKAGTINTIVESNFMDGRDISGFNYADSFIDVKGDKVFIRLNQMDWHDNKLMDHGIHILKRQHTNSNIYSNTISLGNGMPFLFVGKGTVHAKDNNTNEDAFLARTYSSGTMDNILDSELPAVYNYSGFQGEISDAQSDDADPDSAIVNCLQLDRYEKVEVNQIENGCIEFPTALDGHLLQIWDSKLNPECNFRGNIVEHSSGRQFPVSANYAGTRSLSGNRINILPDNECPYLIIRWL